MSEATLYAALHHIMDLPCLASIEGTPLAVAQQIAHDAVVKHDTEHEQNSNDDNEMRHGQPTRALDVLRHIDLTEQTGNPSPWLIEAAIHHTTHWPGHPPPTRDYNRVAHRIHWDHDGPGDLLAKALVIAEEQR
jgi:hypothetical protein